MISPQNLYRFPTLLFNIVEHCKSLMCYLIGLFSMLQIIGEPSKSLMEEMGKEEKERTAKQAESLGPDGLKKKTERLEKATEDNEVL